MPIDETILRSLIIEDDDQIALTVARSLKAERFACRILKSVSSDLDLSPFYNCRLVIIDIRSIQGLYMDLLTRVRADLPEALLLLLSADDRHLPELEILGVTRATCIADPQDQRELADKIDKAVRQVTRGPGADQSRDPVRSTPPAESPGAGLEMAKPEPEDRSLFTHPASSPAPAPGERLPSTTISVPKITVRGAEDLAIGQLASAKDRERRCHVIVFGSEKGGTGKSTLAMHLITMLLYEDCTVSSLDLGSPSGGLTRYIENRRAFAAKGNPTLPLPKHSAILPGEGEIIRFETALEAFLDSSDYLIIDTPSSPSEPSHMAHARADTLITPINESFIDLEVLARFEAGNLMEAEPSDYAKMVHGANRQKIRRGGLAIDWLVLRNRLSNLSSKNQGRLGDALTQLAGQLGFRQGPGFSERIIYREIFPSGLTLADLTEGHGELKLSRSHAVARQELQNLRDLLEESRPVISAGTARTDLQEAG